MSGISEGVVLAAMVMAVLGAGDVSLSLERAPACVEAARLKDRLARAGVTVVTSRNGLVATLTADGPQLRLRAQRREATFERVIPIGVCDGDALERVITALIAAWSSRFPQAPSTEPAKRLAPDRAPVPIVEEPRLEPEPAAPSASEPEPEASLANEPEPSPPPSTPIDIAFESPPRFVPSSPRTKGVPWEWEASLLGGGTIDPAALATGAGQLQLGVARGHVGGMLELGLQSARSAEVGGVRVETSTQWASLSARGLLRPAERLRVDVALGLRLWRVGAQSTGFAAASNTSLALFGGVASAGVSWRVAGPLAVQTRLFGSLRGEGARFFVLGGPSVELNPWEFGLLAGLSLIL